MTTSAKLRQHHAESGRARSQFGRILSKCRQTRHLAQSCSKAARKPRCKPLSANSGRVRLVRPSVAHIGRTLVNFGHTCGRSGQKFGQSRPNVIDAGQTLAKLTTSTKVGRCWGNVWPGSTKVGRNWSDVGQVWARDRPLCRIWAASGLVGQRGCNGGATVRKLRRTSSVSV